MKTLKQSIRNIFMLTVLCTCMNFTTKAQLRSGYFLDNYTYSYQLNPSFGGTKNFLSFPGLGNMNIGVSGNLHMNSVLYNIDGRTTTFMNPKVSASDFLGKIKDNNRIGTSERIGVLAFGFKSFKGFSTVSINVVSNLEARLPKSIFSLMKEGLENRKYDISNLDAHADAYAELAIGHSHDINSKLRIGATLKFLVGGANIDAQFKNANLTLNRDNWIIQTEALVQANLKGLTYEHDYNSTTKHEYVSGADLDTPGIGGFGMAVDLGATYKLNSDWTFSAAVLDLGFISWKNNMVASTNGVRTFETDKYTFSVDKSKDNYFSDELDRMGDNLANLYELDDMGDTGSRKRALGTTINLGAEYKLPIYRKLSFGLLNTTRIQNEFTWTEFRLSANFQPAKIFSLSGNVAYGTFGTAFGWMVNFKVPAFNLFVGMDHTIGKLCKQYVPLSTNAQVSFGLNFTL